LEPPRRGNWLAQSKTQNRIKKAAHQGWCEIWGALWEARVNWVSRGGGTCRSEKRGPASLFHQSWETKSGPNWGDTGQSPVPRKGKTASQSQPPTRSGHKARVNKLNAPKPAGDPGPKCAKKGRSVFKLKCRSTERRVPFLKTKSGTREKKPNATAPAK